MAKQFNPVSPNGGSVNMAPGKEGSPRVHKALHARAQDVFGARSGHVLGVSRACSGRFLNVSGVYIVSQLFNFCGRRRHGQWPSAAEAVRAAESQGNPFVFCCLRMCKNILRGAMLTETQLFIKAKQFNLVCPNPIYLLPSPILLTCAVTCDCCAEHSKDCNSKDNR